VREAEAAAQNINDDGIFGSEKTRGGEKRAAAQKEGARDADLTAIEQTLINTLGTKVSIKGGFDKGALLIEYFSRGDLDRVYEIITGGQ
jgi:ParB family chromosome partitioning protein